MHPDRRIADVAAQRLAIGVGDRPADRLDILVGHAVWTEKAKRLKNELHDVVLDAETAR